MLPAHPHPLPLILVIAAMLALPVAGQLAEGPLSLDPGLSNLISNIGVVGVLIWYLWYHTSKSYPQMVERFSNEAERMRDSYEKSLDSMRIFYTSENTELRKMLIETFASMRTAVHDVKDTAQTSINKVAAMSLKEGHQGP